MTRRLWLIGGTQESRWLVEELRKKTTDVEIAPRSVVVTVTTAAACALYPDWPGLSLWTGQLTAQNAEKFVEDYHIGAVLDMSHPFAAQISQLAIAIVQQHNFPYLRYERAEVSSPSMTSNWRDRQGRSGQVDILHLDELWTRNLLDQERTLLTIGSRQLAKFAPWQSCGTLFVRVLPGSSAIAAALAAGFSADRIVAIRPPISSALETALWQQWKITQVVTKASGHAGGEDQKFAIAAALGVRLVRITRPAVAYPQQTDYLDTALHFALRYCR